MLASSDQSRSTQFNAARATTRAARRITLVATAAACFAALAFTTPSAHAGSFADHDPCDAMGKQITRMLLTERAVPAPDALLDTYTQLFCGRTPLPKAAERVGFPFSVKVPAEANDDEATGHYERLLERSEFIEQYAFLNLAPSFTAVSDVQYSPKTDVLTLRQTASEGGGNEVQFRRYRNQWIWFADRVTGE